MAVMDPMEGIQATEKLCVNCVYAHSASLCCDAMEIDTLEDKPRYLENNIDVLAVLPVEMFVAIFASLPPSDILLAAALACRAFHSLSLTPSLWRSLCIKKWELPDDVALNAKIHTSWLTFFREKLSFEQPFKVPPCTLSNMHIYIYRFLLW